MSKKLIALASAAALALTGLVGIAPANATVTALFYVNNAANSATGAVFTPGATAAGATADIFVPFNNVLEYTATTARSTLARVIVDTAVGDTVTATSTGALKIIDVHGIGNDFIAEDSGDVDYTSSAGTQSFSKVATTTNVTFYVFTTSTTAASLTIAKGGNSRVVYMKGKAGPAYNISAALPAVIPTSAPAANNVIAKITDVFGNTITSAVGLDTTTTGAGVTLSPGAGTNVSHSYSLTDGGHGIKLHKTSAGGMAINLAINANPANVTGLPTAVKTLFLTTTVVDQTAQITALTAQVAALTAQMANMRTKARSVTKKKYNRLARKWNAANPGARVALK